MSFSFSKKPAAVSSLPEVGASVIPASAMDGEFQPVIDPEEIPTDEEVRNTPRAAPAAIPPSRHTPFSLLAAEHHQKWLAIGFGFTCLVICIIGLCYGINRLTRQQMVFAVDGSGTFHIGPLTDLKADSPVFAMSTILAAQAAFQRSVRMIDGNSSDIASRSAAFDLPELVAELYTPYAQKALNSDLAAQSRDIMARRISQKVEIGEFRGVSQANGSYLVSVRCDLKRSGDFDGQPISETDSIRAAFAFRENPRLDRRGQFPFIVTDFRVVHLNNVTPLVGPSPTPGDASSDTLDDPNGAAPAPATAPVAH